jgi:hypothetical protein
MVKRREFSELRFHYCPVRYKTTLKEQQAKMWLIDEWHNLIVFYLLLNPFCFCQTKLDVHYCGFEQSCKQNKSDVELKTNSCCLPCECTDICKEKDTCCHDKEGRSFLKNAYVLYIYQMVLGMIKIMRMVSSRTLLEADVLSRSKTII